MGKRSGKKAAAVRREARSIVFSPLHPYAAASLKELRRITQYLKGLGGRVSCLNLREVPGVSQVNATGIETLQRPGER